MTDFTINRIHTDFGILRISGLWDANRLAALTIHSIELMGTDGWVVLDQTSDMVTTLISDIAHTLQTHLHMSNR